MIAIITNINSHFNDEGVLKDCPILGVPEGLYNYETNSDAAVKMSSCCIL